MGRGPDAPLCALGGVPRGGTLPGGGTPLLFGGGVPIDMAESVNSVFRPEIEKACLMCNNRHSRCLVGTLRSKGSEFAEKGLS